MGSSERPRVLLGMEAPRDTGETLLCTILPLPLGGLRYRQGVRSNPLSLSLEKEMRNES